MKGVFEGFFKSVSGGFFEGFFAGFFTGFFRRFSWEHATEVDESVNLAVRPDFLGVT